MRKSGCWLPGWPNWRTEAESYPKVFQSPLVQAVVRESANGERAVSHFAFEPW